MTILGIDIGGANIKAADLSGNCCSVEFPLWKHPQSLEQQVQAIAARFGPIDQIALTMTGELADCFETKRDGVEHIVDSTKGLKSQVNVYSTESVFLESSVAIEKYQQVAAGNWHGLARFASRYSETSAAVLLDIGSTTVDVVPIGDHRVVAKGLDDFSRLANHELIYTGVERSSISGLADALSHQGNQCPLMNELFATTLDAYLVLGDIEESPGNRATADGQPRTLSSAIGRLARLIGKDKASFSIENAREFAEQVRTIQIQRLNVALEKVSAQFESQPWTLITSGQGEFLIPELFKQFSKDRLPANQKSLTDILGSDVSQAAPAFAIANLLAEENDQGMSSSGSAIQTFIQHGS